MKTAKTSWPGRVRLRAAGHRPSPRVHFGAIHAVCAITLLFSLCASCGDDESTDPDCLQSKHGMIRGQVVAGIPPGWMDVIAEPVNSAAPYYASARVPVDSLGNYEMLLPLGTYLLRVHLGHLQPELYYSATGLTPFPVRATYIDLDRPGRIVQADLPGGNLRLRVQLPPGLVDEPWETAIFRIESLDAPYSWAAVHGYAEARPVDGIAELEIPFLPAQGYSLRYRSEFGEEVWLRGGGAGDQAEPVTIVNGRTTLCTVALAEPGYVRGSVESERTSRSLVRELALFSADSVQLARDIVADNEEFRIALFHAGPVRLRLRLGGASRWFGGDSFAQATWINVTPGQTTEEIRIRDGGFRILLEGPGPWTRYDARVRVMNAFGQTLTESGHYLEGTEAAEIPNLAPGAYYLQVIPGDREIWLPQWYESADSLPDATPLVIPPGGGIVPVTFHLRAGGSLAGHLTAPEGHAYGADELWLTSLADSTVVLRRASVHPATGAYRFVGLPDDDYRLGIGGTAASRRWYPGGRDWRAAGVLSIQDHSELSGVDWMVPQ